MAQSPNLRIVFAGTPEFAAHHLRALLTSSHSLVGVYTQPDRPAGRGKKLTPSPVKQVAQAAALPVFQPASLKHADAQAELQALNPDIMIVVAYGLLLPQAVLDIPRFGCINVHASLLPRWRGAAPIQRAIEAGDTETGVTIMQMAAGLDTGPMLRKARCEIRSDDTAGSLHDRLAALGPDTLLHTLDALVAGDLQPEEQDDNLSNYARKIDKAEALLDWQMSATELDRKVRAFNPFPMAYTFAGEDRLRIHSALAVPESAADALAPGQVAAVNDQGILIRCGQGNLQITRLQLPGKKPISAAEFANGFADYLQLGQHLGMHDGSNR
jgi:methionyl-tRNA formyltransferase